MAAGNGQPSVFFLPFAQRGPSIHLRQTKNALKIAEEGGKLYDKFVGFVNDMQTIEQSLGKASEAYASAMSKLHTGRGCIVSKVENLKKLGAKTSKTLPSDMLPE